ncbi:hypothetical protein EC845_1212 [Comamonas sp. BIGb0124]|nr:hypothetical protein EC845_1212 [Comamonas sp. BIGb0124]
MTVWLTSARWWVVLVIIAGLTGWGLTQTLRLAVTARSLAELQRDHAAQQNADAVANAVGIALHSRLQQDNTHAFTTNLLGLARSEAAGAARRDSDADRIAGLQRDLRAAATASAQSAVDARAAGDLRDQNRQLLGMVERGIGSVGRLRAVVGRGVEVVERRDAEVSALKGQVKADRAARATGE